MPAKDDRYASARRALERTALGRDPAKLEAAYALAVRVCEKARTSKWTERANAGELVASWAIANTAARKLAEHFETLDTMTGVTRLAVAFDKAGFTRVPPPHGKAFAKVLRALANQKPRIRNAGYVFGPLKVGKSSRKRPARQIVLTLTLAHLFDRVAAGDHGDAIKRGTAWDTAADFATAALGGNVDAVAAKKFLRDHRGHLAFRAAW